jgi:hypothetical protein
MQTQKQISVINSLNWKSTSFFLWLWTEESHSSLIHNCILCKEVIRVCHGLEFQGISALVFEEHGPLQNVHIDKQVKYGNYPKA